MKYDQEMYFIRNIKELKKDDIETISTEYEVITDSHIVGDMKFGPYYFAIWEFSLKKEGEKRKLCLRMNERSQTTFIPGVSESRKDSYYHGGRIADEIVILASLFLRRRLILGPQVRRDGKPELIRRDIKYRWNDEQLVKGRSSLKDLEPSFKQLETFEPKLHQRFILSVKFYHQAIEIIEERSTMAYLNLVSAVEALCQDFDIGEVKIKDIDDKLAELVDKIEDRELKSELEKHIMKRNRLLKRRFVSFILAHLDDSFWEENRPKYGLIEPKELQNLLKRIYDQRSSTLHSGEPFPPIDLTTDGEEICTAISVSHMEKEWKRHEFIPYVHFFERLVNHVLKNFISKNQVAKEP